MDITVCEMHANDNMDVKDFEMHASEHQGASSSNIVDTYVWNVNIGKWAFDPKLKSSISFLVKVISSF